MARTSRSDTTRRRQVGYSSASTHRVSSLGHSLSALPEGEEPAEGKPRDAGHGCPAALRSHHQPERCGGKQQATPATEPTAESSPLPQQHNRASISGELDHLFSPKEGIWSMSVGNKRPFLQNNFVGGVKTPEPRGRSGGHRRTASRCAPVRGHG